MTGHSTEVFVVDQFPDLGTFAAYCTLGIAPQFELAEIEFQGVEQDQPANQCVAPPQYEFDCFQGLNSPDDTGQHAEDSAFGAGGH